MLRYRDVHDQPVATLDRICAFLGIDVGVLTDIPAQNVTTHASGSARNRILSSLLRSSARIERYIPPIIWESIEASLSRRIQEEQRRREPLTTDQRAALLPTLSDDIDHLEHVIGEDFSDWHVIDRYQRQRTLRPGGPIGTAFNSIDRPIDNA